MINHIYIIYIDGEGSALERKEKVMKSEKVKTLTDRILNIGYHSFGHKPVVWKAYNAAAQTFEIELEVFLEPEFDSVRRFVEKAAIRSRKAAYNEEEYMDEAYATNDKRNVELAQESVRNMYESFSRIVECDVERAIESFEQLSMPLKLSGKPSDIMWNED